MRYDPERPIELYVPWTRETHGILPGSAVVGQPVGGGAVLVYFEGNKFDVPSMRHFGMRAYIAAGRFVERYPTVATAVLPGTVLTAVGTYDPATRRCDVTDLPALEAWAGHALTPDDLRVP
jgi:hypothetical protein